jgi:hypothetical protein
MTISSRLNDAGIKIAALVVATLVSFTLQAQENEPVAGSMPTPGTLKASDAPRNIRLAENVNTEARPVQLQNFINSPYDDIRPRLAPSGDRLYFSRNFHPDNVNSVNDPEDIWYSDFDKATDTWSEPRHLTGVLNNAGPNYVNNISVTGDTIILGNQYLKKGKMRAGLSYSVKENGQWSTPTPIHIKNDYNMSEHANSFVSLHNGIIIRSIQRYESIGGRDLFVSFWDGETATEPINMGDVINTAGEESSPFLASDNKTLYFASKGHDGYGGFDIFVTRRLDDTWTNWSAPENLGPAVNSDLDDEFFSLSHCGNHAMFSRQVNVHNNDLFRIPMDVLFQKTELKKSTTAKLGSVASL